MRKQTAPTLQLQGDRVARPNLGGVTPEDEFAAEAALLETVSKHVQSSLDGMGFQCHAIPEVEAEAKCCIYMSSNWSIAPKLLLILQNQVGSKPGLWSRSLCLSHGLSTGSMLPCLTRALADGFGVVIFNPNANSVPCTDGGPGRSPIEGSASPEQHCLFVWDTLIVDRAVPNSDQKIYVLANSNGAVLAKDIVQRRLARAVTAGASNVGPLIVAIATVEASRLVEEDDPSDTKALMRAIAVNFEHSPDPSEPHAPLAASVAKLGCSCLSIGAMPGGLLNVSWTVSAALGSIFRFFSFVESGGGGGIARGDIVGGSGDSGDSLAERFTSAEARKLKLAFSTAATIAPAPATEQGARAASADRSKGGFFWSLFKRGTKSSPEEHDSGAGCGNRAISSPANREFDRQLAVTDFDLIKVVGKGAFGKVG